MDKQEIFVFYEDEAIICCEKPAGVSSQSDKIRDFDMVNRLKNHMAKNESGVPFVGVVHRLDKPVGGIMVFAKNQKAASSLSSQFKDGTVCKKYLAVVTCNCEEQMGNPQRRLTDYLRKDAKMNVSAVTSKEEKDAKKAELIYQVLEVKEELSLVEVELFTGRHHQIRVQLANQGMGIWGDTKYNAEYCRSSKEKWMDAALYSYYLEFCHPITEKKMIFTHAPETDPFTRFTRISE